VLPSSTVEVRRRTADQTFRSMHSELHFRRTLPKMKTPLTHWINGVFVVAGARYSRDRHALVVEI